MPKKLKIGDAVFNGDSPVSYYITEIDEDRHTAGIKATSATSVVVHHNVPWSSLTLLDESQNALRVVREATEDN